MPSLQELPSDLLTTIACYLGTRYHALMSEKVGDLLALRCASKALGDEVRLAVVNHPACQFISFRWSVRGTISARHIAAVSHLFGHGCRELSYTGYISSNVSTGPLPTDVVNPLRDFAVLHTRGRLVELDISYSAISATALLDMCRASPLLKELNATGPILNAHLKSNMDEFAASVSSACPLLTDVHLDTSSLSQAEAYSMYFPRIRCLYVQGGLGHDTYEPTRYDKIEESARRCEHAEELDISGGWVSSELVGALLRGSLRRTVNELSLYGHLTDISPATIVQLAAGLEALTLVCLPDTLTHTPEFYVSLARARPTLKAIYFGDDNSSTVDDASIAAMCRNLPLEKLSIENNSTLTPGVVDIILASRAAETLSDVNFHVVGAFTSANILRLARGCPKLVHLVWYLRGLTPLTNGAGQDVDDLQELLESRAAQSSEDTYYEIDVFQRFGPWRANNYRYR